MSSSFSPTPAELTLVSQLFIKADAQSQGFIPTDIALRLSSGAKISPVTIGEIFNIADETKTGKLSRKDVAVAVRLIGWAQKGEKITRSLLNSAPGPLAVIEGINILGSQNTGISSPKSPPPAAFPHLSPQDRTKFQNLFLKAGAINGVLGGDKARDLFLKSKLSNEQLMLIWNLADTQDRGYLDVVDFTIGMYFIQGVMSGSVSFIPTTLPPGLYQQATGIASSTASVQSQTIQTNTNRSFSPVRSTFPSPSTSTATSQSLLHPQATVFNGATPKVAPALPARPGSTFPQQANGYSASDWDVTPTEKASADRFFDTLDTPRRGYIEGDAAVPFMLKSQLPSEVLAQIWDLADINNDGRLARDGFAIAMHLIQKKLAGHDVPYILPPSLIPPSHRASMLDQSPFSPAKQPEPVGNLLELEDTPPPSATQSELMLKPQITGPMTSASRQAAQVPDNDPFSVPFQPPSHDFFSDTHDTSSPPLHDHSAEIGNVRNQLSSTEKSLSAAKEERQVLEQALADQAVQLSSLQTQLSSAKASYETEMSLLSTLKDRRSAQLAEIQKTREELIRAESDLSAIRVEKAEIEGVFLRDKEEARGLHRRMVETGQQAETLKGEVEKLKKEAKQQRGLLAIARKQFSTKETEKAKAEKEHEEAVAEVKSLNEEKIAIDTDIASVNSSPVPEPNIGSLASSESLIFAAAQPLPVTPDLSQSVKSSNNPFERLAKPSTSPTRSQSPFLGLQNAATVTSPSPSLANATDGTTPPPLDATSSSVNAERISTTTSERFSLPASSSDTGTSFQIEDVTQRTASPSLNEQFVTPPTSAVRTATSDSTSSAAVKFPALEDKSTPFISAPMVPSSVLPKSFSEETDLNSRPQELDEEDSDSEYESEVEDAGAAPAKPLTNGKPESVVATPASDGREVIPTAKDFAPPQTDTVSSANLFDEIFETNAPQPQPEGPEGPADEKTSLFDAFILPPDKPKVSLDAESVEDTPRVAGVDEFDKTLNSIPVAPSSATDPTDFFADSFGDNFDFDAAKVEFPTVPLDITNPTQQQQQTSSTFDNLFGTSSVTAPAPSVGPAALPPPGKFNSTFNDIFDNLDAGPSAAGNKPDEIEGSPANDVASTSSPVPFNEDSMPGAFPSHPVSPIISITSTERDKASPGRVGSPKLQIASPTKDTFEKVKEAPHRHRLSIKLPFRRKKQQAPMPAPASPLPEAPLRESQRSRAGEDDVEPVKQLTAMGFGRDQAVQALEKYDYNVQRALNNLLGTR